MTVLETERLILRPVAPSDYDDLCALYGDADVMRYLAQGVPLDRDETLVRLTRMLTHWEECGFGIWSLFQRSDGVYVGRCGLLTTHNRGAVELAYSLHRRFWGTGLATEAARRVVQYAFEDLLLPRLVAVARVRNVASQRVMIKLGMVFRETIEFEGSEAVLYELRNPLLEPVENEQEPGEGAPGW
jgi:RimJ/RimL family protein N-acetyltransferase